ncbi:MAG: lysophospholipid acyltransferase family protein [Myxococcales bacterium]|nr:acyltransferase family protein [Myxococcota bacterium]MDW8281116.1 lysophospholipid acyltransferase family protein [Myxococcales bacterium]
MNWLDSMLPPAIRGPLLDQRLARVPTRCNEFGYDPFGFHREEARIAIRLAGWLYHTYFRVQVFGIEQVPPGRVLLVANHSGQLPFDALAIIMAMFVEAEPPRLCRAMVEKFIPRAPFVSYLFARWGQIVGTPENCLRLLEEEEAILVFPEGVRGISKPFYRKYQLCEFGTGFLRLALQTGAPVVPVALIGAEEQAPAINLKPLARLLRLPSLPLVVTPPFVPLPYPVKYRIHVGEPIRPVGDPDDEEAVAEQVRAVRSTVQTLVHIGLKERRHVFW